jgi:hypothetical protein
MKVVDSWLWEELWENKGDELNIVEDYGNGQLITITL